MKTDYIIISWSKEQQQIQENKEQVKKERFEAYKEFKEAFCDMFDYADFLYYADLTGLKLSTLLRLARYYNKSQSYFNSTLFNELI